jgi:ADP-heptose:LPS heptosyltransferase
VLLLRPDHIGDVLLTAPAVGLLRASLPRAELTYIVGPWSLEAARHGPRVDGLRTLVYPGFARRRNAHPLAPYIQLAVTAARLRAERFDLVVVFRPDHWWGALLGLAAGIPIRVGGSTPETDALLTHTRGANPDEPAAEQAFHIARLALQVCGSQEAESGVVASGDAVFTISAASRAAAASLWNKHALVARQVVAIQPSAGAPLKSWPVDRWAGLADSLERQGLAVLLCGGPDDAALLSAIQARMANPPAAAACGQSLDVSAAIYERCALLIGLDGGAAHLAAAVDTPTVRLYGPTPAEVFGPWPASTNQRVVRTDKLACAPCGHLESPPCGATTLPACLLALGVDDVLNVVSAVLDQH